MNIDIALFLMQDGVINAAIYAMLSLSLILIFTVTRVISLPQGEYVSYGALTLAALQQGNYPIIIYALIGAGLLAAGYEIISALRAGQRPSAMRLAGFVLYPASLWVLVGQIDLANLSLFSELVLTFALVVPLGPMIYRIVFQPLAGASVLVLLIAAVAVHLVLVGGGLAMFGPEGVRTRPLSGASFQLGGLHITGQSLVIVFVSVLLILSFALVLQKTLFGKALRATAVNRAGARIVGIRPESAGMLAFTIAAATGVLCGVLISPITTVYYDTGFVVALKGFVAAIIAGLFSYPIALVGALFVGVLESFVSFYTSAYRDVLVFAVLLPILLVRSLTSRAPKEEEE